MANEFNSYWSSGGEARLGVPWVFFGMELGADKDELVKISNKMMKTESDYPKNIPRRFLRLLWFVLALTGLLAYLGTQYYTWRLSAEPAPRLAQGFLESGISANLYFGINFVVQSLVFFNFFIIASLVFWRLPNEPMAIFTAVFFVGFGAASAYPVAPEFLRVWETGHPLYVVVFMLCNLLGWPLLVAFFALYPDGKFVPRWMVWPAIYGFMLSMGWAFFPQEFGSPSGWFGIFVLVSVIFVFVASLYAQISRYRNHSNQLQRQQTKWMVYGFAVTVTAIITEMLIFPVLLTIPGISSPGLSVWGDLLGAFSNLFLAAIALAVGTAIFRYRLYDIDLVIRRTLVYGLLTALLVLTYFGAVTLLQSVFAAVSGQQSPAALVVSTLAIAALFNPLRSRVQDFIDRRFYRQKYDVEQALAAFAAVARSETDLKQLSTRLTSTVQETLQPAEISVWLRKKQP
jgi:MFS family permease